MAKLKKEGLNRIYTLSWAATPLVVLRAFDPLTVVRSLPEIPKGRQLKTLVLQWGVGEGCRLLKAEDGLDQSIPTELEQAKQASDLVQALSLSCKGTWASKRRIVVLALGFGAFLPPTNPLMTQQVLSALNIWKQFGVTLVAVQQPGFTIRGGLLDRYIEYVDAPLPDSVELMDLYKKMAEDHQSRLPSGSEIDSEMGRTLKGLTVWQAEQALAEHIVTNERLPKSTEMLSVKEHIINESPALTLISQCPDISEVKGLEALKQFILGTARSKYSKGVILFGPPGTGKSMTAKACASVLRLPLVELNLSAVFGGIVGQSESQCRQAIDTIKAVAPCVVFVDELEKVLSGVASSGRSDGGTTERVAREFLLFLQDRPEGIYVVATSNDPTKVPPEYLRAERWDALFFLDLPGVGARQKMLDQYKEKYGITDRTVSAEDLGGWTGAEIATLCRIAAMHSEGGRVTSLLEAKQWVVPQSLTRKEEIEAMQSWQRGKCVSADGDLMEETPPQPPVTKQAVRALN